MIEPVERFLTANGFVEMPDKSYRNHKCKVSIHLEFTKDKNLEGYYIVERDEGISFSHNLNIYWLIGYLTYHHLIPKDYKPYYQIEAENNEN